MRKKRLSGADVSFGSGLTVIMLAVALAIFSAAALAVPPPLQDQHGNEGGMANFAGKPVIVFVTSLTQLPKLGKWEEAIRPKLPAMNSLDIGDIDSSSKFVRKEVVKALNKHVPKGVSVYIDADNLWAKEYDLNLGDPCLLIFDAEHKLVKQFHGDPNEQLLDEVLAAAKPYFP